MNNSHNSLFEDPRFDIGFFAETPGDPPPEGDPPPDEEEPDEVPPLVGDPPPEQPANQN
jgi:hypothetical protein